MLVYQVRLDWLPVYQVRLDWLPVYQVRLDWLRCLSGQVRLVALFIRSG